MHPRRRRLLLAARALSCGTLILACKSAQSPDPLPGNPKGSWYDDAGVGARGGAASTEGAGGGGAPGGVKVPTRPNGSGPKGPELQPSVTPPPANPKGSWYDDGGYVREDEAKEKT